MPILKNKTKETKTYNVELSLTVTVHADNKAEAELAAYEEASKQIDCVSDHRGVLTVVGVDETTDE